MNRFTRIDLAKLVWRSRRPLSDPRMWAVFASAAAQPATDESAPRPRPRNQKLARTGTNNRKQTGNTNIERGFGTGRRSPVSTKELRDAYYIHRGRRLRERVRRAGALADAPRASGSEGHAIAAALILGVVKFFGCGLFVSWR